MHNSRKTTDGIDWTKLADETSEPMREDLLVVKSGMIKLADAAKLVGINSQALRWYLTRSGHDHLVRSYKPTYGTSRVKLVPLAEFKEWWNKWRTK